MRSTGEVLGLAETFPLAFYKSQEAAGSELPHAPAAWENKKVLISLSNKESQKDQVLMIGKTLKNLGFTLVGTQATAEFMARMYKKVKGGMSYAEAYRKVKNEFRSSDEYNHPYY